jgi:UDP-glucose 4-epimerase
MRVLVTGGAGFIGSHLVLALTRLGVRVAVLDDFSSGTTGNLDPAFGSGLRREDLHVFDVCAPAGVEHVVGRWRPEVVFHLAAQARVLPSVRDPLRDALTNIGGTIAVIQAALGAGSRMVLASSGGAIYGSLSGAGPGAARREGDPQDPLSPYGLSKRTANSYLAMYQRLHGLDTVSLNLGNVYGPRLDRAWGSGFVDRVLRAACDAEPVSIFGDGTQSRDFVYVGDVVEAFLRAAVSTATGEYNIGSGRETTINQVVEAVEALVGRRLTVRHHPANPGEVDRVWLDPGRAARDLGWRASTSLPVGLAGMVANYGMGERPDRVSAAGDSGQVWVERA